MAVAVDHSRPITPQQLRRAQERVDVAERDWREVSRNNTLAAPRREEVDAIKSWIAEFDHRVQAAVAESRRLHAQRVVLLTVSGVQRFAAAVTGVLNLGPEHWWAPGLILGAVLTLPFALLFAVIRLPAVQFVAAFTLAFAGLAASLIGIIRPASVKSVTERLRGNRNRAEVVLRQIRENNSRQVEFSQGI